MSGLPNLNALRVFAAAARHLSFTRAADELNVTQSAVSKQIAALETEFGRPLFVRRFRQVELTPFGARVAEAAQGALELMHTRLSAIDPRAPEQIRLAGDADFIQLWLFPKLRAFEAAHPEIRISIRAQIGMDAPPTDAFDCAVIWGRGAWRGCRFEPLLTNQVFPVCAPGFFDHLARPPRLEDIEERRLIHDQTRFWWAAFREAAGARDLKPEMGRLYNSTALCLEAAVRGDGVTIGDEVSTREHLADGRLTCPFDLRMPSSDAYFLATPDAALRSDAVSTFLAWLRLEAKRHRDWCSQFWAKD